MSLPLGEAPPESGPTRPSTFTFRATDFVAHRDPETATLELRRPGAAWPTCLLPLAATAAANACYHAFLDNRPVHLASALGLLALVQVLLTLSRQWQTLRFGPTTLELRAPLRASILVLTDKIEKFSLQAPHIHVVMTDGTRFPIELPRSRPEQSRRCAEALTNHLVLLRARRTRGWNVQQSSGTSPANRR